MTILSRDHKVYKQNLKLFDITSLYPSCLFCQEVKVGQSTRFIQFEKVDKFPYDRFITTKLVTVFEITNYVYDFEGGVLNIWESFDTKIFQLSVTFSH